jgi:hypothetical protein
MRQLARIRAERRERGSGARGEIGVYTCVSTSRSTSVSVSVSISMRTCVYVSAYTHRWISANVHILACTYSCMDARVRVCEAGEEKFLIPWRKETVARNCKSTAAAVSRRSARRSKPRGIMMAERARDKGRISRNGFRFSPRHWPSLYACIPGEPVLSPFALPHPRPFYSFAPRVISLREFTRFSKRPGELEPGPERERERERNGD